MAILLDKKAKVMFQGLADDSVLMHIEKMCDSGTNIVGGVTPGKGGEKVYDRPLFDTVKECVDYTCANTSIIFPSDVSTKEEVSSAIRSGIKLLVVVSEQMPVDDLLYMYQEAEKHDVIILCGNTAGVITPGLGILGHFPEGDLTKGSLGIVSQSGAMLYYVADLISRIGVGQSTCVSLGINPSPATTMYNLLARFEEDDNTLSIVLIAESIAAIDERVRSQISQMSKPVMVFSEGSDVTDEEFNALTGIGAHPCRSLQDIPKVLKTLII